MQISPQIDDQKLAAFCSQICRDSEPILVPVNPDAGSAVLDCFANTACKASQDGGQVVYGWEISLLPGLYLEAQFHAVWKSPSGELISVTPGENRQTEIVFLSDHSRTYNGARVENLRYSLVDGADALLRAIDSLQSEMMPLIAAGHAPGSAVFAPYRDRIMQIAGMRQRLGLDD